MQCVSRESVALLQLADRGKIKYRRRGCDTNHLERGGKCNELFDLDEGPIEGSTVHLKGLDRAGRI